VEFDRKGKRKPTDSEKLKNSNKVKGSVKKLRYVIIPYDLIENAEEKYDKKSKSKSKSRKGSIKSNDDKSYHAWVRGKSPHSKKMSNPQTSSQP
jgi:hypothetical protein